jgi:hypothetical protein
MLTRDIPYIVTKASDDGTLEVGDRIRMSGDDDNRYLVCENVNGWIDYDELQAAMKGMHCKADTKLIAKRIAQAEARIAFLSQHANEQHEF